MPRSSLARHLRRATLCCAEMIDPRNTKRKEKKNECICICGETGFCCLGMYVTCWPCRFPHGFLRGLVKEEGFFSGEGPVSGFLEQMFVVDLMEV